MPTPADTPTSSAIAISETVASWLLPLDDVPSGPDLEYDAAFLELTQAAAGKPETQFGPAEPPQWTLVREQAEALLARTRDLRVALVWARSALNTDGLPALLPILQLFSGLLDGFWDLGLHPALDPDDGDSFARLSTIGSLDKLDGLLGDVRQALVLPDRRLSGLRVREAEIALERLAPRADESTRSLSQLQGQFGDLPELALRVRSNATDCLQQLKNLQRSLNDRFGIENATETKALRGMLDAVLAVAPIAVDGGEDDRDGDAPDDGVDGDGGIAGDGADEGSDATAAPVQRSAAAVSRKRGSGVSSVESRQDAIRAINLICQYLERSEPTNPAQWLLRRAERLIEKNFLQLVRELAPDAMSEVARIMGVDPDSVSSGE